MINLDVDKGEALMLDASIPGCGREGSPSLGSKIIKDSLEKGIKLQMKGLDKFLSDGYLATAYFCGLVSSWGCCSKEKEIGYEAMTNAVRLLENHANVRIEEIYAVELGIRILPLP